MPVAAVRVAVHTGWAFRPNRGDQALDQPMDPRSGVEGVDRASKTPGRAQVGSVRQAVLGEKQEFPQAAGFKFSATLSTRHLIPALVFGDFIKRGIGS